MGQLVPLRFKPGINRENTIFTTEGGWYDCDKIRFRAGYPETIGGWSRVIESTFVGTCRSLYTWTLLDTDVITGVGTTYKYYLLSGGVLNDITPLRVTTAAGDVTFSASNGSTTLTVTDTGHGAVANDYVTFSGASSLGGNVTAGVLNAEHQIATITDANTYTIEMSVTANASDSGNGGASVVGAYQINVGLDTGIAGLGWGSDPWGDGGWGDAGTASAGTATIRIWFQDNFGEDVVFNPVNGAIYYWDATTTTSARAVLLSSLSGASSVPTVASQVMVSDQDRHVIAFGCDPQSDAGTQDPLTIRWSDQENAVEWAADATNTAGELRLSRGSEIIRAIQTKREIIIFTNESMHSMQYLGPPYTFGVQEISFSTNLIGRMAVAAADDTLYWMGAGRFMVYDGTPRELPCTLKEYVFSDINTDQVQKVAAGHNPQFSEIWWFYPSSSSFENDRYIVYNYEQNIWYKGTMARTFWYFNGIQDYPVAAGTDGYLYEHENGMNDGSGNPAVAISSYIESSTFDVQDGDRFFLANRILPDLTFRDSTGTPQATLTIKARRFPGSAYHETTETTAAQTATVPIEQWTTQKHIRLRGRSMALRVASNETNTSWRLGTPRIEIRTDGKR